MFGGMGVRVESTFSLSFSDEMMRYLADVDRGGLFGVAGLCSRSPRGWIDWSRESKTFRDRI